MNIAVVAGGLSPERDVSLTSGSLIARALVEKGHKVCFLDIYKNIELGSDGALSMFTTDMAEPYRVEGNVPDLNALINSVGGRKSLIGDGVLDICSAADVVFIALHGSMGENGQLQATFDNFGIKYTGSGYIGSLLAMDKDLSKKLMRTSGINTPDWLYVDTADYDMDEIMQKIGVPCVVKPCSCGSSVGVSIVEDTESLRTALSLASEFERQVLIEKKIEGRELTSAIVGDRVLPAVEIIPKLGFYDYQNKYQSGATIEICPAEIPDDINLKLEKSTKAVFKALRLSGYARADYILDNNGELWCLEVNTLPGMTPTSLMPLAASAVGIDYGTLCEMLATID